MILLMMFILITLVTFSVLLLFVNVQRETDVRYSLVAAVVNAAAWLTIAIAGLTIYEFIVLYG